MKRFLTLSTALLIVLASCTAPVANADETGNGVGGESTEVETLSIIEILGGEVNYSKTMLEIDAERKQAQIEAEANRIAKLEKNSDRLDKMIAKLKKYVGKTWYVLSGASPSGWDCSGLVMWGYSQIGVELYHGASKQKHSGKRVKTPKAGDIVAFGWKGYRGAQHTGIYLGDGLMLHAGGYAGQRTEITDISDWAKGSGNNLITYTRILETK